MKSREKRLSFSVLTVFQIFSPLRGSRGHAKQKAGREKDFVPKYPPHLKRSTPPREQGIEKEALQPHFLYPPIEGVRFDMNDTGMPKIKNPCMVHMLTMQGEIHIQSGAL